MEADSSTESVPKPNRIASNALFIAVHLIMYISFILPVYALFTLNYQLILFLLSVSILQQFVPKSKTAVDFVTKYMHPSRAFKSFQIIDDWESPDKSTIQDQQRFVYAFHPHSVYASCFACSMNLPSVPQFCSMVGIATTIIFYFPFGGLIIRLWGVEQASNRNFKRLMKKGKNLGLLPGGFQESSLTCPDEFRCYARRKGFIKYALQYNYNIRPVIILREHQGFWTVKGLERFRLLINKIKLPAIFFFNKRFGTIQPTDLDITIVKGRPISQKQVKTGTKPTQEQIDQTYEQYLQEIERLYSKYKGLNGDRPLKFY